MNIFKNFLYTLSFLILNAIAASACASSISNSEHSVSQVNKMGYASSQSDNQHYEIRKNIGDENLISKDCLTPSEPGCNNMWQIEKDNENKERILNREKKIHNY